jgi:hypothetical protein
MPRPKRSCYEKAHYEIVTRLSRKRHETAYQVKYVLRKAGDMSHDVILYLNDHVTFGTQVAADLYKMLTLHQTLVGTPPTILDVEKYLRDIEKGEPA